MAMRQRWIHAVISSGCLCFLAFNAYMLAAAIPVSAVASHYRFTPRWARAAGTADSPRLRTVGLLHSGCDLAVGGGPAVGANSSGAPGGGITMQLARPAEVDGWWFEPEVTTAAASAVWVGMEYSEDGLQWQEVKYPPWARLAGVASTGPGRKSVDLRPPWQWVLRYLAMMVQGLLLLWICVGGAGTGGLGPIRTYVASWLVIAAALAIAGVASSAGAEASLGWRGGSTGTATWWLQARPFLPPLCCSPVQICAMAADVYRFAACISSLKSGMFFSLTGIFRDCCCSWMPF
jgi:hypothetical protein